MAGVLSSSWDSNPANASLPDPEYHPFKIFFLYITSFMCIVDAITIGPFIAELFIHRPTSFAVVRVLRLIRLYKLLRGTPFAASVEAFIITIRKSLLALSVLVLFTSLGSIVFSAIIYYLESGDFTVNSSYPDGAYLRPGLTPGQSAPSPFVSIPAALYWSVVTVTTVGYGDLYPTTSTGRFFSMLWMFCGVLLIALPVSVLGANFTTTLAEFQEKSKQKRKRNLFSTTLRKWSSSIINPLHSTHSQSNLSDSSSHLGRSLLNTTNDHYNRPSDSSDNFSMQDLKQDSGRNTDVSIDALPNVSTNLERNESSILCSTCPKCLYQYSLLPAPNSPQSPSSPTSPSSSNRLQFLSKQIDFLVQEFQEEKKRLMNIDTVDNE